MAYFWALMAFEGFFGDIDQAWCQQIAFLMLRPTIKFISMTPSAL